MPEPGQPGPGSRQARFTFTRGDICDAQLLARGAWPRCGDQLRRRTHVDRSIAARLGLRGRERGGGSGTARGLPGGGGAAGGPGLHRRGLRQPGVGIVDRGRYAGAELAVFRRKGRRRSYGPGSPHSRARCQHHPVLQQLRPLPVPGEDDSALRHQPARRAEGPLVRGRPATSGAGSTSTTTAGASAGPGARRSRGLYHINGDIELSNVELTQALLDCCGAGWDMVARVEDRKGHDRRYSLDDSVSPGLGLLRESRLATAWRPPCGGIRRTAPGGNR